MRLDLLLLVTSQTRSINSWSQILNRASRWRVAARVMGWWARTVGGSVTSPSHGILGSRRLHRVVGWVGARV